MSIPPQSLYDKLKYYAPFLQEEITIWILSLDKKLEEISEWSITSLPYDYRSFRYEYTVVVTFLDGSTQETILGKKSIKF